MGATEILADRAQAVVPRAQDEQIVNDAALAFDLDFHLQAARQQVDVLLALPVEHDAGMSSSVTARTRAHDPHQWMVQRNSYYRYR